MNERARILVTGGAGYIGSHACKALAEAGFLPVTYDSLEAGHAWAVRWGPLEEGDIADGARLCAVMDRYRPAALMHFAAHIAAGESVADPGKYYRNNVAGSLCLLETMRAHGLARLVFSSSAAVYGTPEATPIPETHPTRPINPYGASKLMIERMIGDFSAAHGLRAVSLRYFNAAGADASGGIGEAHEPETHAIPLALTTALGARTHFEIHGTDYPTPDGTAIRDYVHVSDLAAAHVGALDRLLAGGEGAVVNVGAGGGFSVRQVLAAAEAATGRRIPVREGPRRPGDPAVLVADAAEARRLLDWRPRHTEIADIVASAWAWHAGRHSGSGEAASGI